jgi:hypothetical protein
MYAVYTRDQEHIHTLHLRISYKSLYLILNISLLKRANLLSLRNFCIKVLHLFASIVTSRITLGRERDKAIRQFSILYNETLRDLYKSHSNVRAVKQNYDGLECNTKGEMGNKTEYWENIFESEIIE